jgi:hypothetical protein
MPYRSIVSTPRLAKRATDSGLLPDLSDFVTAHRDGWHQLVVTRAGSRVWMYQDGVSVGRGELAGPYPVKAICAGEINELDEVFGGWLDEIAFYDHRLPAKRVAEHAALGR